MERGISRSVTVSAKASAFVIPNRQERFGAWTKGLCASNTPARIKEIADANGIEVTDDTRITQLWFQSEELDTANLCDHGFVVTVDGERIEVGPFNGSYWPAEIFTGKKEGDVVNVVFPVYDWRQKLNVTLNLELKLEQASGRYRNFGTFEEVLEKCS